MAKITVAGGASLPPEGPPPVPVEFEPVDSPVEPVDDKHERKSRPRRN